MERTRLNKYIADCMGISRRQADRLIEHGRVEVDGKPAHLGMVIDPRRNKIRVDGRLIRPPRKRLYYVFHKPAGYICSRTGRKTIYDLLPRNLSRLDYVGRLDVNTSGVLLMTDDGDFAQAVMRSRLPRVYEVTLNEPLSEDAIAVLRKGPFLDGRPVEVGDVFTEGRHVTITLFEGRWRVVRRIFAAMGYEVKKLVRIQYGPISLEGLGEGKIRELTRGELAKLRELTK